MWGGGLVISPRIEEIVDMWLHTVTDTLRPFMGVGRGIGYFTKNIRIRGHVATRHNGRQYSIFV
jgi:hypothetical protein